MTSESNPLSGLSVNELQNEIQTRSGSIVEFYDTSLEANPGGGGGPYKTNAAYPEFQNPFLDRAQILLNPGWVINVGVNIGFTAIQFHRAFSNLKSAAIEANLFPQEIIKGNPARNGCQSCHVLAEAIGLSTSTITLQVNATFTYGGRVNSLKEGFTEVAVNQTTLESGAEKLDIMRPTFIKIDMQAYERQMLLDGYRFWGRQENILIKLEFARFLLELNETSPEDFLRDLTNRFRVAEIRRSRSHSDTPQEMLNRQVQPSQVSAFVSYVRRRARSQEV